MGHLAHLSPSHFSHSRIPEIPSSLADFEKIDLGTDYGMARPNQPTSDMVSASERKGVGKCLLLSLVLIWARTPAV